MLRGLFSAGREGPRAVADSRSPPSPHESQPVAASYTPFQGEGRRLADELGGDLHGSDSKSSVSWALTFASNLQLARSSQRRSKEQAKKTYHWSFSGTAVKATPTGTESY